MSFLWGSSESQPQESTSSEVSMQTKEFDDLLASKDAELQAILGGLDTIEPSAPSTEIMVPATNNVSEKTSRISSRPSHQPTQTKTDQNNKNGNSNNENTVLGVPRKYVLFVFMTLFMGASLFKFMGSLWGDSNLDEAFSEPEGKGSAQ